MSERGCWCKHRDFRVPGDTEPCDCCLRTARAVAAAIRDQVIDRIENCYVAGSGYIARQLAFIIDDASLRQIIEQAAKGGDSTEARLRAVVSEPKELAYVNEAGAPDGQSPAPRPRAAEEMLPATSGWNPSARAFEPGIGQDAGEQGKAAGHDPEPRPESSAPASFELAEHCQNCGGEIKKHGECEANAEAAGEHRALLDAAHELLEYTGTSTVKYEAWEQGFASGVHWCIECLESRARSKL